MHKININESDMSTSLYIIDGHKMATSEISIFFKDSALDFIENSQLNNQQKEHLIQALEKSDQIYFYSRLKVPPGLTNKGIGTQLLQETLKYIEDKNAFLINTANAYGEKNQDELIEFYQKNKMILIQYDGGLVFSKNIDPELFKTPLSQISQEENNSKKIEKLKKIKL